MNNKILAIGASGSKNSINQVFANYVAGQLSNEFDTLDISQFSLPIFTIDEENTNGLPKSIEDFHQTIKDADILVISLAEHNGTYTSFFKNVFDWLSRKELRFFTDKKVILTATAPGPRGGQGVLDTALERFPRHGADIIGHFVLPKFKENFDLKIGIINEEFKLSFNNFISEIQSKLFIENKI